MIGALAGLGGALLNFGAQRDAQASQEAMMIAQLQAARRREQEQTALATAPRRDAFGNTTSYMPGEGFSTRLSPLQQALLDRQQSEQARQFAEDVPRGREAASRADARARRADARFHDAMRRAEATPAPLEKDFQSRAVLDALDITNSRRDGQGGVLANEFLRGEPGLGAAARMQEQGPTLAEVLSVARQQGSNEFGQAQQRHSSKLAEAMQLAGLAERAPGGGASYQGPATGQEGQMLEMLMQVMQQGGVAEAGALRGIASTQQAADYGPLMKAGGGLVEALMSMRGGAGNSGSSLAPARSPIPGINPFFPRG